LKDLARFEPVQHPKHVLRARQILIQDFCDFALRRPLSHVA
jgi:hypothetical protein